MGTDIHLSNKNMPIFSKVKNKNKKLGLFNKNEINKNIKTAELKIPTHSKKNEFEIKKKYKKSFDKNKKI